MVNSTRCSTSAVIRKVQIVIIVGCFLPTRMAGTPKTKMTGGMKPWRKQSPPSSWWGWKMVQPLQKMAWGKHTMAIGWERMNQSGPCRQWNITQP